MQEIVVKKKVEVADGMVRIVIFAISRLIPVAYFLIIINWIIINRISEINAPTASRRVRWQNPK